MREGKLKKNSSREMRNAKSRIPFLFSAIIMKRNDNVVKFINESFIKIDKFHENLNIFEKF